VTGEFRQGRLRILADVVGHVESVQAIDTDEKYMLDVGLGSGLCKCSRN
jgi:uncharacterized protein (DUF111 family)